MERLECVLVRAVLQVEEELQVVHLGHMYKHAEVHGITARKGRFEFSALNMGGTVVGGALTTMGAAVMMLGCQLLFFTKMAGLILATICFSFMFSLGFFMPLALIAGPEQAACNSPDAPPVNQPADPAAHVSEVTASEPGKVLQIRAAADV